MGSAASTARTPHAAGNQVTPVATAPQDGGRTPPDDQSLAAMPVHVAASVTLPAPPAQPPLKRKSEVCPPSRFTELDRRVSLQAEIGDAGTTLFDLAARLAALVDDSSDDVARLRTLFFWLASIDVAEAVRAAGKKADKQADNVAVSYLVRIQRRQGNYAQLMAALCNCARIPVRVVTGVTKSATYRVGKPIDRASATAQWNAVHVAGEWRLLDCLWASNCAVADDGDGGDWELLGVDGKRFSRTPPPAQVASAAAAAAAVPRIARRMNDFFFLPDPAELGATHFPNDAEWQLVEPPATWTAFEEGAYVRERFFQLGARTTRPELGRCALRADDSGAIVIELEVAAADSPSVTFKYALSRAKADRGDSGGNDAAATAFDLHKCVFFEQRGKLIRYTVRFPVRGDYKFDVYGRDSRAHAGHDLMCSYLVTSEARYEHSAILPDEPAIGWGPGASCDAFGLTAVSHLDGRIDAEPGEMDVVFSLQYPIELRHELSSAAPGANDASAGRPRPAAPHASYSILTVHEGVATVSLRIAKPGVYVLKLFAGEERIPAELQNVCNYLITLRSSATVPPVVANAAAFPALVDGHLGTTSYSRELGVEPLTRRHPVMVLVSGDEQAGGAVGSASASDGHIVDVAFACGVADGLSVALSTSQSGRVEDATNRCRRTLTRNGCYSFLVDMGDNFELLLRFYACRAGDAQRLYNVYNCLVRAPRNAAAAATTAAASSADAGTTLITRETATTIEVARACVNPGVHLTKKLCYLPPSSDQATLAAPPGGGRALLKLKLVDRGEYAATVYERVSDGCLQLLQTYSISREGDNTEDGRLVAAAAVAAAEDADEFSLDVSNDAEEDATNGGEEINDASKAAEREARRAAQQALRLAVDAGILAEVQGAIAGYLTCGGVEGSELMKAARRIEALLQATEALLKAMESDSLKPLQDALTLAKATNAKGKLSAAVKLTTAIKVAERKLAQLLLADQLSKAVFSLDQRTMSEMRAYAHPPEAVYLVAKATLLLLGTNQAEIQDWRQVQAWLGKTGQESLKRRVMLFDYRTTPIEHVGQPQQIYSGFTLADVRAVSAGAATFFVWGTGMIGLIEQLAKERQEKQPAAS